MANIQKLIANSFKPGLHVQGLAAHKTGTGAMRNHALTHTRAEVPKKAARLSGEGLDSKHLPVADRKRLNLSAGGGQEPESQAPPDEELRHLWAKEICWRELEAPAKVDAEGIIAFPDWG